MPITAKLKTAIDVKTVGSSVLTHHGSTVYAGLSPMPASAASAKLAGGFPIPTPVNKGDVGPMDNPAAFYVIRNNRLFGPYVDLTTAKLSIEWIESRENEVGADA